MLGIPPATLRTWEERYGLLVPERSPGGHRVYSRDQVEQLRFVKAQLDQGISPADAPSPARRAGGRRFGVVRRS
ncbi:MAG TPA: MerR family transcriptional regulator [Actinomycetota bacterium]|nr:MerR family transcriptional regulator [Actinomycetota bacterium]